mgnify:CR=1 FL=1
MAQAPKGMRARRPDSPGAKKNTSSLRTSVAEALREALGCDLNASSWFFCTHTAAYHLPAKAEKSVRLQRASATQCSTARRGASKARFVSVDDCGLMLGAAWGHAMLACSGPATARSPNARKAVWGPRAPTWPPLRHCRVETPSTAQREDLVNCGAACQPSASHKTRRAALA